MAQDINAVFEIGRLTKDPEVKYTTGGTAKMEISIAVNRSVKEGDSWVLRPSYFDVEYWGKRAESINQYLHKGKQIGITGYLDQKRWTTPEGQNRSKIVIVAMDIELIGGEKQEGHSQQSKSSNNNYDDYSYGNDYPSDDYPF